MIPDLAYRAMKSTILQLLVTLVAVVIATAFLMSRGLPPDKTLLNATRDCDLAAVQRSLGWGADTEDKDDFDGTPLHCAAIMDQTDIAALLIRYGADVNVGNNGRGTPLAEVGKKETALLLLAHGADLNARNREGWTPLYCAAYWGKTEVAQVLLAHGADPKSRTDTGATPLHAAAAMDGTEIAELLLAKGAEVNARNAEGQTPLSVAVGRKHDDMAELLRRHGARE